MANCLFVGLQYSELQDRPPQREPQLQRPSPLWRRRHRRHQPQQPPHLRARFAQTRVCPKMQSSDSGGDSSISSSYSASSYPKFTNQKSAKLKRVPDQIGSLSPQTRTCPATTCWPRRRSRCRSWCSTRARRRSTCSSRGPTSGTPPTADSSSPPTSDR